MKKTTFLYDDGTWGLEKGTSVEVRNYYDDPLRNWSEVDYLELIPKDSPMLKIPKTHIVEIDFITNETFEKKSKLLRGLAGLAIAGGFVAGLGAAFMINPITLMTAGVGFGNFTLSGGVIGALTGFGSKPKKENFCIISYLTEIAPEDLKVIILNANTSFGNSFVKDRKEFTENLETQIRRSTRKAACVEAFTEKIEKVLELQEKR